MAAEDKVRFQMEMQQYTANQAAAAPPQVSSEHQQHYYDPNVNAGVYDNYGQPDPYGQHNQYHAA